MPPYMYVKIIWRITGYSTLFILKRNTGNWFYLLSYVRLWGIFLEKVRQKMLFRTTCFCLFTRSLAILFSGVDIRMAIRSQLPPVHWKWRGTAYRWEAWLIEFTVNQSPDDRGSSVLVWPEDGGSTFLWSSGIFLPNFMVSDLCSHNLKFYTL
jgi:hypothetical protein